MFHALEEDVDTALKATRPILSILPRRGQVHFYILPDQCDQRREFAHGRHVSALSLTKEELALSLPIVDKVLKRVGASRGVRINGLESKSSPALTYFTYHIDLEAA